MPIYEYECRSCGKLHEIMQRYSDLPLAVCPDCGGPVRKLISNTSFVLKGSGWYKTDYGSGSGGNTSEGKKGNGEKPETKSEGKSEDKSKTKSETKPEKKLEPASKPE